METLFAGKRIAPNMGPLLGSRLQGTAALQVNVVFQGGMASAFAKASPFAKGFGGQVGGHVRAVPIIPPKPGGRPVPRRRTDRWKLCLPEKELRPIWGLYWFRLQGTAALQAIGLANPEASANLRRVYF